MVATREEAAARPDVAVLESSGGGRGLPGDQRTHNPGGNGLGHLRGTACSPGETVATSAHRTQPCSAAGGRPQDGGGRIFQRV